jgi:mRNA interferase HigB
MKVRLILKETIEDYVAADPRRRALMGAWLIRIKHEQWNTPADIKKTFPSVDFLENGTHRVVFKIGNNYRLICLYVFARKHVYLFICWVGTNAEYADLRENDRQRIIMRC